MINTALMFLLAGGAVGGTVVAYDGFRRKRRVRQRAERLQDLRVFARRRGLSTLEDSVPEHVAERSTPRNSRRRAEVEDVMLGRDERGNYYVLRRRHAGRHRQLVTFDLPKDSHIDGLSIEPYQRKRALSFLQTLLRRKIESRQQIRSVWDCEARAMFDEASIERVGRLTQLIARHASRRNECPLRLDVDGRRVVIRSDRDIPIDDLYEFLDGAVTLRNEVIDLLSLRSGYSTEIRPITEAVREVVERNAVQKTMRERDLERRQRAERQSGPWSTVMDIPPELLAKRDRNAVEEPEEEEVVVITSSGMLL